jgi:hypothetical protein
VVSVADVFRVRLLIVYEPLVKQVVHLGIHQRSAAITPLPHRDHKTFYSSDPIPGTFPS